MGFCWHGSCYMKILDITMDYFEGKIKNRKKDERKLSSLKVHYRQIHKESYPKWLPRIVSGLYYIHENEKLSFRRSFTTPITPCKSLEA